MHIIVDMPIICDEQEQELGLRHLKVHLLLIS